MEEYVLIRIPELKYLLDREIRREIAAVKRLRDERDRSLAERQKQVLERQNLLTDVYFPLIHLKWEADNNNTPPHAPLVRTTRSW